MSSKSVVIVSNRLPITIEKVKKRQWVAHSSPGGLVTAMGRLKNWDIPLFQSILPGKRSKNTTTDSPTKLYGLCFMIFYQTVILTLSM